MKTTTMWRQTTVLLLALSSTSTCVQASNDSPNQHTSSSVPTYDDRPHPLSKATRPGQVTLYNVPSTLFAGRRFADVHASMDAYVAHYRDRLDGIHRPQSWQKQQLDRRQIDLDNTHDELVTSAPAASDSLATLLHVQSRNDSSTLTSFSGPVDNSMDDNEFLIQLGVGTPMQTFWALPDTGSPLTWVYGPNCCYPQNHSYFDYRNSSSFSYFYSNESLATTNVSEYLSPDGLSLTSFSYGKSNGTLTTFAALDVFDLPNFDLFDSDDDRDEAVKGITATDTTFALSNGSGSTTTTTTTTPRPPKRWGFGIVTANDDPSRIARKMEALIGMAPGLTVATHDGSSTVQMPIEALFHQTAAWSKNVVTFTLIKKSLQSLLYNSSSASTVAAFNGTYGGRLTFGDIDEEAIQGEVAWLENCSDNFWATDLEQDAMQIDGVNVLFNASSDVRPRVIFDTGSAVIFMPATIANYTNSLLHGARYIARRSRWVLPCSYGQSQPVTSPAWSASNAPRYSRFTIKLGAQTFGVPDEDLVVFPDQPVAYDDQTNERFCLTAFQTGLNDFTVLGQTFIKNHVVIFDFGNKSTSYAYKRIGIANRKDIPSSIL